MPIANCPFPNQKSGTINVKINHILQCFKNNTNVLHGVILFLCETFSFKIMVNASVLKKSHEQNTKVKYNTMINMGNNSRLMSKVSSRLILSLKTGKVITVVINRSIEFLQKCS